MPAAAVEELLQWEAEDEEEDADARRREVYGDAGGELFGIVSFLFFGRRRLSRGRLISVAPCCVASSQLARSC